VGLPTGRGWPDWCDGDLDGLRDRQARPTGGVLVIKIRPVP
jgi:hypothetical protein